MSRNRNTSRASQSTRTGQPVPGFSLSFTWSPTWEPIFDAQTREIQARVRRARENDLLLVYLSCPISSRGGGWSGTNVDIAKHVENVLSERWGEGFWILNPSQYQLESKPGRTLMTGHAKAMGTSLAQLQAKGEPGGGDYMRMWTKVLVEDERSNAGRNFDAFYFLGPRDVHSFFLQGESRSLTDGIELYFSRKCESDVGFRDHFSAPDVKWGSASHSRAVTAAKTLWKQQRMDFLRFYALRASANFSLGSHDEWAIFRLLNDRRRKLTVTRDMLDGDVGDQIAGFFDGNQVDLSSSEAGVSRGNAR
jgi:hypothetical protein